MNLKLKVSAISLMVALCFVLAAFDMNDVQERKIAQPGESTKSKSIDYQIMVLMCDSGRNFGATSSRYYRL